MIEDRDFLAQLKQLELYLKPSRSSQKIGFHEMAYRGKSLEFSEYREYRPGDDLKDLDWKVFARSDRYYIKQRDTHSPATTMILVDNSASMNYCSPLAQISKLRSALLLAFGIGYVLYKQGDAFSFHPFHTDQEILRPRSSRKAFSHLVRQLETHLLKKGIPEKTAPPFKLDIKPSSIDHLFLVSDFMVPAQVWKKWLKSAALAAKHISVFRVLDPCEENPDSNTTLLENLEHPKKRRHVSSHDWDIYRENFKNHAQALSQNCLRQRFTFGVLSTGEPAYAAIRKVLSTPSKQRRL